MAAKVFVIGATGTVGRELVGQLLVRNEAVRAGSRNPAAAARGSSKAVEWVEFDLVRPETFAAALAGVDRVFLMARPGDEQPERTSVPLIDAMKRHGVRHVVDLSAMGADRREDFGLRKVERYLESSGLAFTHLRPNWFMQVFSTGALLAGIRSSGALCIPAADAKISYIDARDVAAVGATVMTQPGHAHRAYTLTGGEALDHEEVARLISGAAGRSVRYVPIDDDTARKGLAAAGFSGERVERLVGFYRMVRQGFCAPVFPDVQVILGRRPISFEQFAGDYGGCGEG